MSDSPASSAEEGRAWPRPMIALLLVLVVTLAASLATVLRSADAASGPAPGGAAAQGSGSRSVVRDVAFAIHVGTASLREGSTPPETIAAYEEAMTAALEAGRDVIMSDGSGVDAVQAAVEILEDDPTFNAGRGAVFNTDAAPELDASIMDGETLDAGAVAGVRNVKNPVAAARLVMDTSPHVLLSGQGADTFALRSGLETVTQDYYFTQSRWDALLNAKRRSGAQAEEGTAADADDDEEHGTVGAIARDTGGNLAAATSTGGLTNKAVGRIGDSPLVSAGTWADNNNVAVSGTGVGEIYIRLGVARDIGALYEYRAPRVDQAAEAVLDKVRALGGTGGVIVLDTRGNLARPRTGGMPTGYVTDDGEIVLDLFRD